MSVELLAATGRRPAVEVVTAPEGERLPLPTGLDDSYGFDHALPRRGWVAVQIYRQLAALVDGDLLHPRQLPRAFGVAPAADPSLAVIGRYPGDSAQQGDPQTIELVGPDGVHRSVTTPTWGVVGELASGRVVTRDALVSWEGDVEPLPLPGEPFAVVGGRHVLTSVWEEQRVRSLDVETGDETSWDAFEFEWPTYSPDATAVALRSFSASRVRVVSVDEPERWIDVGFEPHSLVWLGEDRLLAAGDRGRNLVVDVAGGTRSTLENLRNEYVRVDVTGRFDLDELRAALQPSWKGAIPESRRRTLAAKARERLDAAAGEAGVPVDGLADVQPAIRVRSCLPPKRIAVGASRLGGRPDLSAAKAWPQHRLGPMTFLGQFRLDELSAALPERALPTEGLLVVFAWVDAESGYAEGTHVEVVPTEGLARGAWPAGLPEELRYEPALAALEPALTPPDAHVLTRHAAAHAVARFGELVRLPGPAHQLFGHASTIQGVDPPAGHELLLQFDGDALLGASFGDGGRLHVWRPAGSPLVGVVDSVVTMDSY